MAKRRVFDLVDSYHRIPRFTYNKIVEKKEQENIASINKTLCLCLEEYFSMKKKEKEKEASEAQKEVVL